jgi:hypothetical protein
MLVKRYKPASVEDRGAPVTWLAADGRNTWHQSVGCAVWRCQPGCNASPAEPIFTRRQGANHR